MVLMHMEQAQEEKSVLEQVRMLLRLLRHLCMNMPMRIPNTGQKDLNL